MSSFRLPDGARLAVERLDGRGLPVLFLHGILEDRGAWRAVASRVHAAGRACLLVDARAHGASEPWREGHDWSPRALAEDVAALLEATAPEGAHLVGHSHGATAASWVAVERPGLARSLAVVASPPDASEVFRAHFRRRLDAQGNRVDARTRDALAWLSHVEDDAFPTHALRRYRGPALVVEAGDDPLYSPTHTLFWRAYLPYASFERVEEGGHGFFAGEPGASWLAARLLAHLAEADGAAA